MASETREFEYRVAVEWCQPCSNGMFMSGGRFLTPNGDGNHDELHLAWTNERTFDSLALRAGMEARNFSAGGGIRVRRFGMDYAYLDHRDLDSSHRVSLSYAF